MFSKKLIRLFSATAFMSISLLAQAETTLVAVADNFAKPITEIASEFSKTSGHTVKLSLGSSGKFVAQIENGAPFDVFLSAGNNEVATLQQKKLAIANSHFTYAMGKLVLWSKKADLVDGQGEVLEKGTFKHLALADPKLAPYGEAAVEVLKHKKLFDKLQPLLVQGENISQAFQFVSTGNAELGFIALSQVIDSDAGKVSIGSSWMIPENLYSPIKQNAVLLKKGENNPAAVALLKFLKSESALAIIKKYGYGLAN